MSENEFLYVSPTVRAKARALGRSRVTRDAFISVSSSETSESIDNEVLAPMTLSSPPPVQVGRIKRMVLVVVAVVFSLTLSGVVFGWPAVVIMLQEENVYNYLCNATQPLPCPEQVDRFNLIFTIASTGFACSVFPMGIILDRFGPKVSSTIGSALVLGGAILFAVSDPPRLDTFIPGYLLIAIGGPPIVFSFMHISNLFPENKGTVITMLNVALDASSLIFVVLGSLYSAFPQTLNYKSIFLAFAALPLLSLVVGFFLWPMKAFELQAPTDTDEFGMQMEPVLEKTFKSQVASLVFWLCAIFTTLNLFRVNYYIGTVGEQLLAFTGELVFAGNSTVSTNELQAEFFTEMFAYFLPLVGVLSVPVIGVLLDKVGLYLSIWVLVVSGVLYAVFSLLLFMPIEVQLITFILVAFFRALLFSVMATYVAVEFSFVHFGKLWGIVFLMGGIVNLGEYFMTVYANGQYFWINVTMLILSVVCIGFPVYLAKHPPPEMAGPAVH